MTFTAKGLATRQRIIEGAAAHLRADAPGDVTLDDIRRATRTSKSQIFHYFPGGKEELFLEVARYESNQVIEDQQPYLGALDSWEAWELWRQAVVARYRAQGPRCPLASVLDQVGGVPGAAEVATVLLHKWQAHIHRGIVAMQARGEIRPSLDAAQTASAFVAGIQGGVTILRTTAQTAHLESTLALLLAHLRSPEPGD
ncbi:TetR/AcrR family transcriptional regulator [Actinocorallia sp. A-T 12471]|uniref:TetR/AcrR family transcriptional regulator n=1 Tax=Actinocorallia sp. A-T 12471 TaxID=3089813 RepID=UPI0029CFA4E7|nr:TetR/AcrR family transcriptional regulator [Actinocorallia sp. A-T 12471]MDX6740200.1 TetR/AcrR family transcriptional regulator [Actinocorallia sp. A-T 12471]